MRLVLSADFRSEVCWVEQIVCVVWLWGWLVVPSLPCRCPVTPPVLICVKNSVAFSWLFLFLSGWSPRIIFLYAALTSSLVAPGVTPN